MFLYKSYFYFYIHYFTNPNSENVRKLVRQVVYKFKDDPTVKEYGIIYLLGQIWVYAGKRKGFGRARKENEFGRKRECRNIS